MNTKTTLILNQQKLQIPILKEVGMHNLMMDEFWMLDLFRKMDLTSNALLIDLGANVGQTLLKWKSIYPESRYLGVEPIPTCVKYLEQLIKVNSFNHCQIIDKAISDKSGKDKLAIHFDEASDRTASLVSHEFDAIKEIEIQTILFQDLIGLTKIETNEIDCIKIDVEGGELAILEKSLALFEKSNAVIIIEILGQPNDKISKINQLISNSNYLLFNIKKRNLHLEGLKVIEAIIPGQSVEESDYLLISKADDAMLKKLHS